MCVCVCECLDIWAVFNAHLGCQCAHSPSIMLRACRYVYADGEVRVYIANSLFTQRGAGDAAAADAAHDGQGQDGAAADAAVGRPQGEVTRSLRPAGDFFNLIIKQISNVKNRRS